MAAVVSGQSSVFAVNLGVISHKFTCVVDFVVLEDAMPGNNNRVVIVWVE
jgi:hypothetical protein